MGSGKISRFLISLLLSLIVTFHNHHFIPNLWAQSEPLNGRCQDNADEKFLPPLEECFQNMNDLVYAVKNKTEKGKKGVESRTIKKVGNSENSLFVRETSTGRLIPRKAWSEIGELILKRSPQKQLEKNAELTTQLGEYGMSFKRKDDKTHQYDEVFIPPVNGVVIPIKKKDFNNLAQSAGPIMRAFGEIDALFYSTLDKEKDFTSEMLIKHFKVNCTPAEVEDMVQAMKRTIYDIPQLHAVGMKDYPFISVAGGDAMISDPEKMDHVFAEFNLGTPSGISNQRYNIYNLLRSDKEMAKAILPRLSEDRTFEYLKKTIEDNAKHWTGNSKGITVMVGAGEFNAAHPDISSISHFSGMPLVRKQDMYIDKNGDLRLNVGELEKNPVVTGIYSREEESFFLNDDDVPFIDPGLDEEKMAQYERKFFLKKGSLKPGVVYQWIRKANPDGSFGDEIVGVMQDKNNRPLMAKTSDPLGVDPTDPGAKRGSLIEAIKNKKLYTNVIGGRVMDDKKVFEIVRNCFAEKFTRPGEDIASPSRSYPQAQWEETILADYRKALAGDKEVLAKYVIKKPDDSGGAGVYILVNYSPKERLEIVERELMSGKKGMVVQDFVKVMSLPVPVQTKAGKYSYRTHAGQDLRIFMFKDYKGDIRYDWMGVLSRVAKATVEEDGIGGDPRSNTSAGGGYGVLAALEDGEPDKPLDVENLLKGPKRKYLPLSKRADLFDFLRHLVETSIALKEGRATDWAIKQIAVRQLNLMDILGPEFAYLMSTIQQYQNKNISKERIGEELDAFKQKLCEYTDFTLENLNQTICKKMEDFGFIAEIEKGERTKDILPEKSELMANLTMESLLHNKKKVMRLYVSDGTQYERVQSGVYKSSKDPFIQYVIDELKKEGGKLYHIHDRIKGTKEESPQSPTPFFMVENGVPQINVNLFSNNYALSSLAHEFAHFEFWKKERDRILKETLSPRKPHRAMKLAAIKAAEKVREEGEMLARNERNSVMAEMQMDKNTSSLFNRGLFQRAFDRTDPMAISRLNYPEIEGLRSLLFKEQLKDPHSTDSVLTEKNKTFIKKIILEALKMRKESFTKFEQMAGDDSLQEEQNKKAKKYLHYLENTGPFNLIFFRDINLFFNEGSEDKLAALYTTAWKELFSGPDSQTPYQIGPKDDLGEENDKAELYLVKNLKRYYNHEKDQDQQQ